MWTRVGGGLRASAAVAKVFFPPRRADGKCKAKMAGGGSDVQMADAAGAAGSGANGAGSPAGRAGSEASVRSGSRRDGSSADNGRDMRGSDYPDGADDQEAEPPLVEGAGPSPIRRTYFSPPSLGTRDQGLSRIYLRGIYPGIISKIIRNMGLDDIFGSEYAFLSERIIIHQTAQAADYIVFSGVLLYSSISDRHGVSHVWRRFSARSRLRRRRNASGEWRVLV